MITIDDLCSQVSAPSMFRHLEEFARRVKLSGTPEELESFRYLQAELDKLSFQTKLIQHDAYISLPGRAQLEAGPERPACITHSFSRSTGPEGVTGPLVYLGSGTEKDFAGRDVRGKIVLVDGIASPAVSLRATLAGGIGQIHISADEHKHEMCISPIWGSPTHETLPRLPQTVVLTIVNSDGERLKQRLAHGELDVRLYAQVDTGWRQTPILVADLPTQRADPGEPFVLFSGHHDTWYFGVMDNGGANATMLELARLVAPNRPALRRGLRLCFWSGHSHGRYSGSTWYADHHWEELSRRCLVHVNVDSTGAKGNTVLSDMPASAELRSVAEEAVLARGKQELDGLRMSRAGDQSFWGIGIPSLFMTAGEQRAETGHNAAAAVFGGGSRKGAGLGWWWHTPEDTLDKMDADLLVRDTQVYVHAIWRLLTDPVIPLDYASYADALLSELALLEGAENRGVDPARLLTLANKLRTRADEVRAVLSGEPDAKVSAEIEACLLAVSRHLVPVDYTSGDRFGQDLALPQPAFPVLEPLRRLCAAPAGSDEAHFLSVAAVRGRNRMAHALEEALRLLEACLSGLSPRSSGNPA